MKKMLSILCTLMLISGILVGCSGSSSLSPAEAAAIAKQIELAKKREVYAAMILKNGILLEQGDQITIRVPPHTQEFADVIARQARAAGASKVEFLPPVLVFQPAQDSASQEIKALSTKGPKGIEIYSPIINDTPSTPKSLNAEDDIYDAYEDFVNPKNIVSQASNVRCIVAYPNMSWAKKVYPDMAEQDALIKLTEDIYNFTLTTTESSGFPEVATAMQARAKALNSLEVASLHYTSDTMNLTVPIHENNLFIGGIVTMDGESFYPNIPTFEVYGAPSKFGVNGTVKNTRPLLYQGKIIDGISMTFAGGELVDYSVESGKESFDTIIAGMPDGVYLGEISIVNGDTPIAQDGTIFYNALLDENAGSHLALGRALPHNLKEGAVPDENFNQTKLHIDIIIGNLKTNVTATLKDGRTLELLKDGKWVQFY